MDVLVENGADTDWTEPNGTVVSKHDILDWCEMRNKPMSLQSEFDHAFCRLSRDTFEYPLYATRSQVERYRRTFGFLDLYDTGSEENLDTEMHEVLKPSLSDGESLGSQGPG